MSIGQIATGFMFPFAGTELPDGFLWCDGSEQDRQAYLPLFSIIGTAYGAGDGTTTFNVPDCRGRSLIGVGQGNTGEGGALGNNRPRGEKGGAETCTLSTSQMPAHTHGVTYDKTTYASDASLSLLGSGNRVTGFSATGVTSASAGSGAAHNNQSPYVVVNWIIRHS